jgi:hypothetical protein
MATNEKNRQMKGVTFNLDNPIERFLWEKAEELKEKKVSFSNLMKNFFFLYLVNTGQVPPEFDLSIIGGKKSPPTAPVAQEDQPDTEGILNAPFSLGDEEE